MTINQIDQLKNAYAEMLVEDMEDLKEEIIDCYGEETWTDMNS